MQTEQLFATLATADAPEAGVGVIWWARHPPGDYALTVLDYDVVDTPAIDATWVGTILQRCADLAATHAPAQRGCFVRVEHPGLVDVIARATAAFAEVPGPVIDRTAYDFRPVREHESEKWPATLDERAFAIRPLVDSGRVVKLERGLRRLTFRAIRTNHLIAQIRRHRPGDAASAGELLHAFVLGVLLGTKKERMTWFSQRPPREPQPPASRGPFGLGAYIPGPRPR